MIIERFNLVVRSLPAVKSLKHVHKLRDSELKFIPRIHWNKQHILTTLALIIFPAW